MSLTTLKATYTFSVNVQQNKNEGVIVSTTVYPCGTETIGLTPFRFDENNKLIYIHSFKEDPFYYCHISLLKSIGIDTSEFKILRDINIYSF